MIQLSRNYTLPEREEEFMQIKIVGVGGAGANALDRVVLDGLDKGDLVAVNTDVQALSGSVAALKVQLGRGITRGLGAGGDPEVGFEAAQESAEEIRHALAETRVVFICAGLGGGTGSGAAPLVAQIAREAGSIVIAFATMPFSFEGKRRAAQANDALLRLHEVSDAVICFDNDRMGDIVAPKAGIHQAFAAADVTISQSVRSIINLIQRPGLIRIGFDDLLSALRGAQGRCLFGFGESDSDNRAHDALTQALKNPLMDRGRLLSEAGNILVQVAGGPGLTLSEVEILMGELNRHISERTQILFGTAVDGRMGNRLSVTIISSLAGEGEIERPAKKTHALAAVKPPEPETAIVPAISESVAPAEEEISALAEEVAEPEPAEIIAAAETVLAKEERPELSEKPSFEEEAETAVAAAETPELEIAPPPRIIPPKRKPVVAKAPKPVIAPLPELIVEKPAPPKEVKPEREKLVAAKQEVLQFEPITRGRFEKSEPTIVEGQDLDVPTFLRKNVRVK